MSADVTSDTALQRMTDLLASAAVDRLDAVINCVTAFDGRPRPVGELLLCTQEAAWLQGQVITADGGLGLMA